MPSPDTFDRTPPWDEDAEASVLCAMMIDQEALDTALETLVAGMFYREANGRLFRAMSAIRDDGAVVDVLTLADKLRQTNEVEAVGGLDYVGALIGVIPTSAHVLHHARIVRDKATLRRLVEVSTLTIQDVYDMGDRTVSDLVGQAETRVLGLGEKTATTYGRIKDGLWDTLEEIEANQKSDGKVPGIPTGLRDLDRKLLGLHRGQLTVVAGRPSMGKTSLAMGWALHASMSENAPTLVFSFEMTRTELTKRALAHEGRIDLQALMGGRTLSTEESGRMAASSGHLNMAPLYIDDAEDTSIQSVLARTRRAVKADGIQVVVIDYLQLMEAPGENRRQQIDVITRRLKGLAKSLDVAVVLLSQLSRGPENRPDKRPILSDLRESGGVEQDADNVVMVYRPEYYMNPQQLAAMNGKRGLTELIIPKQRNGPTGTVRSQFAQAWTRFDDPVMEGSPVP